MYILIKDIVFSNTTYTIQYIIHKQNTYIHTYVHTRIHTYIHACMHTYIPLLVTLCIGTKNL